MISILLVVAIIGVVTWLIVSFIPMPAPFPRIIVIVAVILVVLYLLWAFGVRFHDPGVPQLRN